MIRRKSEHLGEMTKCSVHIVFIVETKTSDIDSIGIHVVNLEDGVGRL